MKDNSDYYNFLKNKFLKFISFKNRIFNNRIYINRIYSVKIKTRMRKLISWLMATLDFLSDFIKTSKAIKKGAVATAVFLIAAIITVFAVNSTRAFEVTVDDEVIGVVREQTSIQDMLDGIVERTENICGAEVEIDSRIGYREIYFAGSRLSDLALLEKILGESIELQAIAYAINVDGEDIAYLKDMDSAEEVLNRIREPYVKQYENAIIDFVENVSIISRKVPISALRSVEEVFQNIYVKSNDTKTYIVQKGDTVSEIAEKFSMSVSDIKKANPDIDPDLISIGQELRLTVPRYVINVKKTTYEVAEASIPYDIEYEHTDELYREESRIKVQGEDGRKLVTTEHISINGVPDQIRVVKEEVIQEPKNSIVLSGTRERPRTIASGVFSFPTSRGGITSYFGERWGSIHKGIDIGVPYGTPNRAADGGVVIFAGWNGDYGNLVIIDHENGYTTYYAHNDTIEVEAGERVYKGQVIGTAGSTGRSTGPHLHFEVRKNGVPVDPLDYLQE